MEPRSDKELRRLEELAHLMDEAVGIPGTELRVGLDPLVGLVPGAGDTLTAVVSLWIVFRARRLGVSRGVLLKMAANVAIDWLVGSIPVLGDLFDFGWKANRRNLRLMRRDLEAREEGGAG